MHQKNEIDKSQKGIVAEMTDSDTDSAPFLEWKYALNEETGKHELKSIDLSDGKPLHQNNFKAVLKRATGTTDLALGERILRKIAYGMTGERADQRLNEVSALLPALRPKDETEALLLGQFLALQDSGIKCLRNANLVDQGFYHKEKLFLLANKLLCMANQTMQAVLKYRSGGQQVVQVLHVHNEGNAIVAQNISNSPSGAGSQKKSEY